MQGPKWNKNIYFYLDYVALIPVKFLKKLRKTSMRSHNSVYEQLSMTTATYRSWLSFWQSPATVHGRFVISMLTAPNPSIRSAWNMTNTHPPHSSYLEYEKWTSLLNWFVSRKHTHTHTHTHTQIPTVILLVYCRTQICMTNYWCVRFVSYTKPAVHEWKVHHCFHKIPPMY